MIKLILVVVIIGLCGYLGWGLSMYFKRRKKFFTSLNSFVSIAMVDMNYSRSKLSEIIKKQQINDSVFEKVIQSFERYLNSSNCELTMDGLLGGVWCLKQEEKEVVFALFSSLGRHDIEGQNSIISSIKQRTAIFEKECDEVCKKYCALYVKLGFLFGAMIAILFI